MRERDREKERNSERERKTARERRETGKECITDIEGNGRILKYQTYGHGTTK